MVLLKVYLKALLIRKWKNWYKIKLMKLFLFKILLIFMLFHKMILLFLKLFYSLPLD